MSARILKPRTSLLSLLGEIRYTLSRLQAKPLTATFAPTFAALRAEWTPVQAQEIACFEAVSDAQAYVDQADDACDDFAGRVAKAVLIITGDNRNHPLYTHFFGRKSLTEFRRPVLNGQLEAMRLWIDTLSTSPHATLQAMAPELIDIVAQADKAVALRDQAMQARRKFRDIGERRQLFDKVNAARKVLAGSLAKLGLETPGLPADFADHFFRTDAAAEDASEEDESLDGAARRVAELEEQLTAAKETLAARQAHADAAGKAAAEKLENEKALAAIEKEEADIAARKEALQKKLGLG